jgi:hypothetical protein
MSYALEGISYTQGREFLHTWGYLTKQRGLSYTQGKEFLQIKGISY